MRTPRYKTLLFASLMSGVIALGCPLSPARPGKADGLVE